MFGGSLHETHVCAGEAVQSDTCSGTTNALLSTSPDSNAVIMCLKSVLRAEVARESRLCRQHCLFECGHVDVFTAGKRAAFFLENLP
jgi:hypothetical protein